MANKRIYLSPPHLEGNERAYLLEALDSNWIAPTGPFVDSLEDALRRYSGTHGVTALNSGTSGLHLALRIIGVGPGDEVLCPTFSFIASAGPITYLGAKPVFVDCETQTWNMDPSLLDHAIQARRAAGAQVKAVIFAYCYGMPGFMDEILAVCQKHNLPLIEDAAEALGSTYKGRVAGTLGDFGVYSFNGNKIVTGSVGGALLCRDASQSVHAKKLASQAKEQASHFEHHEIGYNYGMSNLVAAIILGQFECLTQKVNHRRDVFEGYREQLGKYAAVKCQRELEGVHSNRWLSAFSIQSTTLLASQIAAKLATRNIETRPLWKPLHIQQAFLGNSHSFGGDKALSLFANGICLPSLEQVCLDDSI